MSTILGLFIALFGLIIYMVRPQWLFLYWILTWPILSPVLCLLGGLNDPDSANDFLYRQSFFFSYTFLLIILTRVKRIKLCFQILNPALVSLIILCMYFLFHSVVTNFSTQQLYLDVKNAVFLLLPLMVLIIDNRTIPDSKSMYRLIFFIMIVEVIFVYLNLQGINAYAAWYISVLENPEFATLASGTFYGSARFPDYCVTVFTFLTIDFFTRRIIPFYQYAILSVLCIVCLFSAGSRLPLALSVIILITTVFLYGKQYKTLLLTSLGAFYAGLLFLSSYSGGEISEYDGVNRIVNGLSSFTQSRKDKDEDNSTLRLSEKLLDGYFWQSPIIGHGRACLGDNAYPIADKVSDTSDFKADARLAFMVVEYGLLGVFLYFLFFTKILKSLSRMSIMHDRRVVIILMALYAILAITEGGFWDANLFPFVYLYYTSLGKCSVV